MKTKPKRKLLPGFTYNPKGPSLDNEPFVLEKEARARAFFAKHGYPEDVVSPPKKVKKG